jgi:predicted ribosomally synthesized peptide with nif11-like leader
MKTLGEFIQRLQDDAAFEKKAQAFDNGDKLMAFVKREGYDFTLEQLTAAFKQQAKLPPEAGGMAPAPPDARASTPPGPGVTAFPRKPEAVPHGETSEASPKNVPPKDPEEKSTAGLLRGGGGRHRGFSAQRLKSVSGEDS